MEDIEDMFKADGEQVEARLPATKRKIMRNRKKTDVVVDSESKQSGDQVEEVAADANLPGK